jgi:hypothetical protein
MTHLHWWSFWFIYINNNRVLCGLIKHLVVGGGGCIWATSVHNKLCIWVSIQLCMQVHFYSRFLWRDSNLYKEITKLLYTVFLNLYIDDQIWHYGKTRGSVFPNRKVCFHSYSKSLYQGQRCVSHKLDLYACFTWYAHVSYKILMDFTQETKTCMEWPEDRAKLKIWSANDEALFETIIMDIWNT